VRLIRPVVYLYFLGGNSAKMAIGLRCSIGQKSAAYLPFSFEWSGTAAFLSGECVLRAQPIAAILATEVA